jgi:methionyl-tRNA formyltransferase
MPEGWRIGVISSGPDEFTTIHAACTEAGHRPVVYVYGRSLRSGGPNLDDASESIAVILRVIPPDLDLLLPGTKSGLARTLAAYDLDLLIVFGFAWKLPPRILAIPRLGAINIHVSMLPTYRGPAPMLWAIRNGDATGGVTVHRMDEGFDTGNILAQQDGIPLPDDISWQAYCVTAMPIIHKLLRKSLDLVAEGHPGTPQDDTAATYAGFMEDEFNIVDWSRSARDIHNQVRPHRYTRSRIGPIAEVDGRWLHLVRTSREPAEGIVVTCGDGGPLWIVESEPARKPGSRN